MDYEDFEEEESTEEELIQQAYLHFTHHFQNYVKEMAPDLWQRAIDYAKTFTEEDVTGISLDYIDKEDDDDSGH